VGQYFTVSRALLQGFICALQKIKACCAKSMKLEALSLK